MLADRIGMRRLEWAKELRAGKTRGTTCIAVQVGGDAGELAVVVQDTLTAWLASAPSQDFPPPRIAVPNQPIFLADAVEGFTTRVDGPQSLRVDVATHFAARGWKDWLVVDALPLIRSIAGVRECRVVWPWEFDDDLPDHDRA